MYILQEDQGGEIFINSMQIENWRSAHKSNYLLRTHEFRSAAIESASDGNERFHTSSPHLPLNERAEKSFKAKGSPKGSAAPHLPLSSFFRGPR